jgi:uncharacterized membrane protein
MKFGVAWGAAFALLALLDAVWLGLIAREFYKDSLGPLLRERPNWPVALLFYVIHTLGIAAFAVPLAMAAGNGHWLWALGYGALYGFCVYAAYDITNLATLRSWPVGLTIVDLGWGTLATALATTGAYLARNAIS